MKVVLAFGDHYPSETFVRAQLDRLPLSVFAWRDYVLTPGRGSQTHTWGGRLGRRLPHWYANRRREGFLKQVEPDAVLANFGTVGARWVEVCRRNGVPLFTYFHGRDVFAPGERAKVGGYETLFREARGLFSVSQPMSEALVEMGADPARVHRIPCGADPQFFSPTGPLSPLPRAVAVGRLVPKKCPHVVVRAFARASQGRGQLTWVGDGPLRRSTERLARDLGANVRFTGTLSPEGVRRELALARVYLHWGERARDGDAEGTPVAVVEAQAMGLPAVVSNHMGLGEVVRDGETGRVVEDPEGFEAAISQLLFEPEVAESWGVAGRERVLAHYSVEQQMQSLLQKIREGVQLYS